MRRLRCDLCKTGKADEWRFIQIPAIPRNPPYVGYPAAELAFCTPGCESLWRIDHQPGTEGHR